MKIAGHIEHALKISGVGVIVRRVVLLEMRADPRLPIVCPAGLDKETGVEPDDGNCFPDDDQPSISGAWKLAKETCDRITQRN